MNENCDDLTVASSTPTEVDRRIISEYIKAHKEGRTEIVMIDGIRTMKIIK